MDLIGTSVGGVFCHPCSIPSSMLYNSLQGWLFHMACVLHVSIYGSRMHTVVLNVWVGAVIVEFSGRMRLL